MAFSFLFFGVVCFWGIRGCVFVILYSRRAGVEVRLSRYGREDFETEMEMASQIS